MTKAIDADLGVLLTRTQDYVTEIGMVDGIGILLGFKGHRAPKTEDVSIGSLFFPFEEVSAVELQAGLVGQDFYPAS